MFAKLILQKIKAKIKPIDHSIMKKALYALVLSVIFFSCQQNQDSVTYTPREITADEKFNGYIEGADSAFSIRINKDEASSSEVKETYHVKFKDTLVKILINKDDPNSATDKFASVQFINTQKTTLLVQIADKSGLTAPCYLLAANEGKLEVISLYRPSTGKEDAKYTKGINRLGRAGYIINNDFFITNVNAQVYLIKRQNPDERIQGEFVLNSPDKTTLIFLTANSLYQVNYQSNEVLDERYTNAGPQSAAEIPEWVRANFIWKKNKKGMTFLRFTDNNRIVDIKEFQ